MPANNDDVRAKWIELQEELRARREDATRVSFSVDVDSQSGACAFPGLRYVAGVDVSFYPSAAIGTQHEQVQQQQQSKQEEVLGVAKELSKTYAQAAAKAAPAAATAAPAAAAAVVERRDREEVAVVCLAVLEYPSLRVVHSLVREVRLPQPYIPGFLAFRECPAIQTALAALAAERPLLHPPQLLLVDGNGMLHPRAFGVACHAGVVCDIPTIGVAKNLLEIRGDGITAARFKQQQQQQQWQHAGGGDGAHTGAAAREDMDLPLVGTTSGTVYGVAMCTSASGAATNPVFVSAGHRVCLGDAVRLVRALARYRVPEPIRQADLIGRKYVQQQQQQRRREVS
ncbi:hypothetical protein HDU83_009540 [Entophlyctis luteolus]|nr:hypothetical protein HDU83_009540 [Entophlyctis luteolus]